MRIIHITPSYKPAYIYGGTTISVSQLCEALIKTRYHIEVITTTANGHAELQVKKSNPQFVNGVKVTYFKRITKDHTHFSPCLLLHINHMFSKSKSGTIVHIHSWWNLVSILSCLIARFKNIPVVLSPRGMITAYSLSNRNSILKLAIHYILGKSLLKYCHVHATSKKEEQDILQVQTPKSITVIPNIINSPPINQIKNHADTLDPIDKNLKQFNLIFLSRIEKKKGLEFLMNALKLLDFPWKLTIAGTGTYNYVNSLKKLAYDLRISSSIQWTGQISNYRKYQLIANNDLLVLFSYNENFANVIAESLSVGTPVAISKGVGLAPFIIEHNMGWVSEQDPLAIASILDCSYKSSETRKKIRQQAPILIKSLFSTEVLLTKYLSLYKQIQ